MFCCSCNKSVKLNKQLQIANVDEHVNRQQCSKEKDLFGMYLWATGAHVAKLKGKLRLLSERISDQENEALRKAIFELNSMPQDIMFKLESIETLVAESVTTEGEIYLESLGDVKRYIKPWNTYQELRNSADNKKRVDVNILMEGISR